jgi:hypothetical protein
LQCLLCAKEEENIEHFILNCKSLRKVRNTIAGADPGGGAPP